jgi:hypothetical protein
MGLEREEIRWLRHSEAEALVADRLSQFVAHMPPIRALEARIAACTNSRLMDWLDYLVLVDGDVIRGRLVDLGFELGDVPAEPGDSVYVHPGAIFPRFVLRTSSGAAPGDAIAAAIQVEDVSAFLMAHHVATPIEGTPLSPYRRARVWQSGGRAFSTVERRGYRGFLPQQSPREYPQRYLLAFERWATRPRRFDDVRQGMEQTLALARSLVSDLGVDTAAWIVAAAERSHWQRRNRAAQVQASRQGELGLGWTNHDHYTFRSSREVFYLLVQILEALGFQARERFYAGAEAGWGAQVMEQPACGFAVFADVDLAPDEVDGDFAHQPLAPRDELATVGLWCALHGESMLSAGLHHLACRLDFDAASAGLAEWNVRMMRPFSDFPHLRQAFTRGERWDVPLERLERLAAGGHIDAAQRERFATEGAVGSHLENIQRGEGFKGFNPHAVSDIMRRIDPRVEFRAA